MNKYYQVYMDDFEALPFYSDMDEGWEGHSLIIEEQHREDFIAEQVANFTRHLLSIMHEMPTRGKYNPFKNISQKYSRVHRNWFGDCVACPCCKDEIDEEEWNSNTNDMRPCCPTCEYEFEMEESENK